MLPKRANTESALPLLRCRGSSGRPDQVASSVPPSRVNSETCSVTTRTESPSSGLGSVFKLFTSIRPWSSEGDVTVIGSSCQMAWSSFQCAM